MPTNANLSTSNKLLDSQSIGDWLAKSTHLLREINVDSARLDCLILLEDATGKDRSWLIAHPEYICPGQSVTVLNKQIGQRASHEPLAYIRGKCEFYGREFMVSPSTLVPRPESEMIIELLLKIIKSHFSSLLKVQSIIEENVICWDVGCGSGCLGITAKLEVPRLKVIGTDISQECLEVARENAKTLTADVEFIEANLLATTNMLIPTIIMANLPYVPNEYKINQAAKHEPGLALYGGKDGLDLYRKLFAQTKNHPSTKYILTESLDFQQPELISIALQNGYKIIKTKDLVQVFNKV